MLYFNIMPVKNSNNYSIAVPRFGEHKEFSNSLSNHVRETFGEFNEGSHELVSEVLKASFKFIEEKFMNIISTQTSAAFYLFVHNFHENSCLLWERKLSKLSVDIDSRELATVRRVYKIILEQGSGNSLTSSVNYSREIFTNRFVFLKPLEDLLFLGGWAIVFSEYISKHKLYPNAVTVKWINGELINEIHPHLNAILTHFEDTLKDHEQNVVVCDVLPDFKALLLSTYNLNYNELGSFLNQPQLLRRGVCKIDVFMTELAKNSNCEISIIRKIFEGFTVSASNKMSFEDCIIRNQEVNRYMCRPLLKLSVDNEEVYVLGLQKWAESLVFLSYNCYPFGIYPSEWKTLEPILKFMNQKKEIHDLVLEDVLVNELRQRNIRFSHKVGSIKTGKGQAIPIRKLKGVGEIDLLIFKEEINTIYVCECKHNRSKFDVAGWYRDVMSFKGDYEEQLRGKVEWSQQNINSLIKHFEIEFKFKIPTETPILIQGIFIVNAPTLYLIDCIYPTFTVYTFIQLLENDDYVKTFVVVDEETENETIYTQPFLRNVNLTCKSNMDIE